MNWQSAIGTGGIVVGITAVVLFFVWLGFYAARRFRERFRGRALDEMEGHDFEYFCADLLEQNGFIDVEVTKGSGDYGVDVLAEKDGVTYAVQCKRYDGPVGVKAVQEAYAGRDYYDRMVGADYGVDVLAEKDGVTYAVQCKRYDGPVGVKAVQEAYAGRDYYDRMVGAVMTNQYFTEPAVAASRKLKILLWDRGYLETMMEE